MHVSYAAFVVGALGLIYGLTASKLTEQQATIGAVGLGAVAIAIIAVPLMLGVPW